MRSFLLVFCYVASLLLSACHKANTPPVVKRDFDAVVTVDSKDTDPEDYSLQAEVSAEGSGTLEITLISPSEFKGLSYIWDEGFEMSYSDLHCQTEKDYLPDFSFAQAVYNVINSVSDNPKAEKTEEGWLFVGDSQSGKFEVDTDKEGYIQNISIKEINLKMNFEYEQ